MLQNRYDVMNYFYRYAHGGLGIVSILSILQILLLFWLGSRCPRTTEGAMPAGRRDILVPIGLKIETGRSLLRYCIETRRSLLPEESRPGGSPTGTSLASRPGGLSYPKKSGYETPSPNLVTLENPGNPAPVLDREQVLPNYRGGRCLPVGGTSLSR